MKILAYIEHRNGELKKNAFEVATAARSLAERTSGSVTALLVGTSVASLADGLGAYGISDVLVVEDSRLEGHSSSAIATAIAAAARSESADVVLVSNTAHGKDLAPKVGVKLEAGVAPDAVAIDVEDGDLRVRRPVYAGKAHITVKVTTPVKVVSLRPNVFTPVSVDGAKATTRALEVSFTDGDFSAKVVETKLNTGHKDVLEADVVVSGGRGLKGPEHFHLVEELAEAFGGAVGASRAVVDAGWRPHSEQVGQTGKTVSPSLYVACGISGAVQHLAGMSSSKYILAVNKDKDAPIFAIADYGVVGDAFDILPILTSEVRSVRGNG